MRKSITIAIALSSLAGVALATSTIARADTTDDAIRVAYKASNATQSAIYKDVCVGNEDDSLSDHRPDMKTPRALETLVESSTESGSGTSLGFNDDEDLKDVYGPEPVEVVQRGLVDRAARADAGVIHKDVEAPVL